ncbi:hypothetical protein GCM10009775_08210 [Microbacterium aoyamense]|uniref:DUF1905 domain-containing protein n=1 Tax=Microbacterium aoyamense TaxID=344166 RepID=A0ABN2PC63_9MICO|nr:YdeI/OmpD-associated family protein [Microbacterium aoyamense]
MRYETTMSQMGNNTGIEVPLEILEQLGGGKRPAVKVVVNGFAYDSTVGVMGGRYLVPFSSDKRAASGIQGGDAITVDIELDTAPRTTVVPDDLAAALAAGGATSAFDKLAPSARKAHVTNVEGAKTDETRARRVASIVDKLRG